jgi:mono/diheme cytochrome c family protein
METNPGRSGGSGRSGTNGRRVLSRVSGWRIGSGWLMRLGAAATALAGLACAGSGESLGPPQHTINEGKQIFRFETFGDETFWTDTLGMHQVVQTLPPTTALSVGLKVDADTLPPAILQAIQAGQVDLSDPATTVRLLKLGAVVGLRATVDTNNQITRLGITCALCHSTVDNRIAPGIGSRLDGWPNLELNPGAIIALSPALTPAQQAIYNSWGPGRFDPRHNLDGLNGPVLIPPAYGLKGVHSITVTGDGPDVAYWNRYVGVTQMHGHGSFVEPRLGINIQNPPDLISSKLAALQAYQLSINAPSAPAGSFDAAAATRGRGVFVGAGQCSTCHTGTLLTDANTRLHLPADVVSEPEPNGAPSWASRSATKMYRTTPLRALQSHPPYFHNGIAPTLDAVVDLYITKLGLQLTPQQKADLVQYLRSL